MFALKMSPLERCFSRKLLVIRADTVPLPDPGGPIIITRKILWRDIPARFFCPAFQCRAAYLRCGGGNHSWMRNWIRFHFLLLEVCNVAQRGGGLCSPSTLTQPSLHFLPCCRETNEEEEVQRRRGGGGVDAPMSVKAAVGGLRAKQSFILQLFAVYILLLLYNRVM